MLHAAHRHIGIDRGESMNWISAPRGCFSMSRYGSRAAAPWLLAVIFMICSNLQTCRGLQFCQRNDGSELDLCMAVATVQNAISRTTDTHFSISARFVHRRGWAAFGIGDQMSNAMMLVVYPGRNMDRMNKSMRSRVLLISF